MRLVMPMHLLSWLLDHGSANPCLYAFPFSLPCIMVRFTIAIALRGRRSRDLSKINHRLVNIHRNENLTEGYLSHINPNGEVPTLTAKALSSPLTDFLAISYWVCEQDPTLLPESHQEKVVYLLDQLHKIQIQHNANPAVEDLLARDDITATHRQALEYKRDAQNGYIESKSYNFNQTHKTEKVIHLLAEVLVEFTRYNEGKAWIFGDIGPTLLDTHMVPFIARLMDIHLGDMVPPPLLSYAKKIMKLPAWEDVMKGRPTVWDSYMGSVEQL